MISPAVEAKALAPDEVKELEWVWNKLMKNLLPLVLAVVLGVACFMPASAPAYVYRGRYYPYYYGGHYYRYRYGGHYYRYRYHGRYYLHRAWVPGPRGYYRYW